MPGLQPLPPGPPPCSRCGREAAGQCARCHAYLCADCAVLVPGLSRPQARCPDCAGRRERAGRRLLAWLLVPGLLLALAALLLALGRG